MSYDVPFRYRLLDWYLKYPVLYDLFIGGIIIGGLGVGYRKSWVTFNNTEVLVSLNTDLISVTISLAGFILAALTIIVTFKDSLDSRVKTLEDAKTGKELFFASSNYFSSVRIFYWAAIILIIIFVFLSVLKVVRFNLSDLFYGLVISFLTTFITLTTFRVLYLLILIIKIQKR